MIYEVAPAADFDTHWQARAAQLAKGPTATYGHLKAAIRGSFENTLDAQLALEARLQGACGKTHDFAEGIAAFQEKRAPTFRGR